MQALNLPGAQKAFTIELGQLSFPLPIKSSIFSNCEAFDSISNP